MGKECKETLLREAKCTHLQKKNGNLLRIKNTLKLVERYGNSM